MSIQLSKIVRIDDDNAHDNNVSNVDNSSSYTKKSVKCLGYACCVKCVM